jgi:hypothetical protein
MLMQLAYSIIRERKPKARALARGAARASKLVAILLEVYIFLETKLVKEEF